MIYRAVTSSVYPIQYFPGQSKTTIYVLRYVHESYSVSGLKTN